jgi:hypothetical protein
MNNSFGRLIDGMSATLRAEVLPRIDDEYARGQVWGVINLLNTFKVRADWSADFLVQQIEAQRAALAEAARLLAVAGAGTAAGAPSTDPGAAPAATPVNELLAARDRHNRILQELLAWLEGGGRASLPVEAAQRIEQVMLTAMRAETEIELKHSPRPLFAEMSGAAEG